MLVSLNKNGLYCAKGDFYIDPLMPVERAFITHAHSDHCRKSMGQYYAEHATACLAKARLGSDIMMNSLDYAQNIEVQDVTVSFHPAGHILGSSQIRIQDPSTGETTVVSGDYKVQADPSCHSLTPLQCDCFVTEATFALPVFIWPDPLDVMSELVGWVKSCFAQDKQSNILLFAYSLGKSQRILMHLMRLYPELLQNIIIHRSVADINVVYRQFDVDLPMLPILGEDLAPSDCKGKLIITPPTTNGAGWTKSIKNVKTALVSGWMTLRGQKRRQSFDRGFVMSDHADWRGLLETIEKTKAKKVYVTHGYEDVLVRYLSEKGLDANSLAIIYGEEEK